MENDLIATLESRVQPVLPHDSMAEAGRKVLLTDFIKMLKHEAGSRSGEDAEDVHDMRVATRRMRSALRLLEDYYKPKVIYPFRRRLRKIARALGAVRDLDVLLAGVKSYSEALAAPKKNTRKKSNAKQQAEAEQIDTEAQKTSLQSVIERVIEERDAVRGHLIALLDSKRYRKFIEEFADFLTSEGRGAGKDAPYPLALMLPNFVYEHLAAVRAFDDELQTPTPELFHPLRVEFKRLRYVASFFTDVMGSEINDFLEDLKKIQDHLGHLNDVVVAQAVLGDMLDTLDEGEAAALQVYIDKLAAEQAQLQESFLAIWHDFNSKAVQQKLALSVAAL